jgi:hypothetical protein
MKMDDHHHNNHLDNEAIETAGSNERSTNSLVKSSFSGWPLQRSDSHQRSSNSKSIDMSWSIKIDGKLDCQGFLEEKCPT